MTAIQPASAWLAALSRAKQTHDHLDDVPESIRQVAAMLGVHEALLLISPMRLTEHLEVFYKQRQQEVICEFTAKCSDMALTTGADEAAYTLISTTVHKLHYNWITFWDAAHSTEILSREEQSAMVRHARAFVDVSLSQSFRTLFAEYMKQAHANFERLHAYESGGDVDLESSIDRFNQMTTKLNDLGQDRLIEDALYTVLNGAVKDAVAEKADGQFNSMVLSELEQWTERSIRRWIAALFRDYAIQQQWIDQLIQSLQRHYCRHRTDALFDMIVDYPDSLPAIQELKATLLYAACSHLDEMIKSLRRRLLHCGAKTSDIIDQYINTIKALLILDSSGVILELVAKPIRDYLRGRSDTIRCVINKLFDGDQDGDLAGELNRTNPIDLTEECENYNDEKWSPLSRDLGRDLYFRRNSDDILSTLVSIYDSKEVFIKEFQSYLASRLLATQFEHEKEIGYVELLKLRFGCENCMQHCEVMIKDMADSKRLHNTVRQKSSDNPVQATILSHLFWPSLRSLEFTLPAGMQEWLNEYSLHFKLSKRSRDIRWNLGTGTVDLVLDLDGQCKEYKVAPIQASIIWCFQEQSTWSTHDLAQKLDISKVLLRPQLAFWAAQGVLAAGSSGDEVYQLSGTLEDDSVDVSATQNASGTLMPTTDERREEEMQIFSTFIFGMLTNLGALPLNRIQTMLAMFVQTPTKYDRSEEELHQYLARLVRDDKLECNGGLYKLKQ